VTQPAGYEPSNLSGKQFLLKVHKLFCRKLVLKMARQYGKFWLPQIISSPSFMEKFLNCSVLGIKPTQVSGAALPTKEVVSTKCCLQSVGLVTINAKHYWSPWQKNRHNLLAMRFRLGQDE